MVFYGEEAHEHHRRATDETAGNAADAEVVADVVSQTADDAGKGVNFLAEDEWYLVDEYITQHAAAGTGDGAHDDGSPEGETCCEGAFDAGYGEEGKTDGVEEKPCVVLSHKQTSESNHPNEGDGGADEIERIVHPKGRLTEHDIAHRPATDGCGYADNVCAEKVETLGRSEADAGDGKGECADKVEYLYESDFKHGVLLCECFTEWSLVYNVLWCAAQKGVDVADECGDDASACSLCCPGYVGSDVAVGGFQQNVVR